MYEVSVLGSNVITKKDILTAQEAAHLLRVDIDTVYEMVRERKLPFQAAGNELRFPGWLLIDWMVAH